METAHRYGGQMSAIVQPLIVCDHPDCGGEDAIEGSHAQTLTSFRRELREVGWRHDRNGNDWCPDHATATKRDRVDND